MANTALVDRDLGREWSNSIQAIEDTICSIRGFCILLYSVFDDNDCNLKPHGHGIVLLLERQVADLEELRATIERQMAAERLEKLLTTDISRIAQWAGTSPAIAAHVIFQATGARLPVEQAGQEDPGACAHA